MPRPETKPAPKVSPLPKRALIQGLMAAALLIDVYLAWVSLTNGAVAGCGLESNCHTVLNSRWSHSFGLPVSLPALLIYMTILGATFGAAPGKPVHFQRNAWLILIPGSVAVVGAALWFVALQLFVIGAICRFCMTAHACAFAGAALILWNVPVRTAVKPREIAEQVFVLAGTARILWITGLAGVGLLIAGQMLTTQKTFITSPVSAGLKPNAPTIQMQPAARKFQLFDGQFEFELAEVPLMGKSTSTNILVSLFDYTCHYCRQMHQPLMDAFARFSNDLAIISLPMPLDAKCNPLVQETHPDHTNACALARLGLAVWRADPKASRIFDDWIFGLPSPPLPSDAEVFARQLVGNDAWERACKDPWIEERLRQDIAIYEAAYRKYHKSRMPEIIIGTNLHSGVISSEQLFHDITNQFGLN